MTQLIKEWDWYLASTKARLVDFGEMEQGKRKTGGILNSDLVWFGGRGG